MFVNPLSSLSATYLLRIVYFKTQLYRLNCTKILLQLPPSQTKIIHIMSVANICGITPNFVAENTIQHCYAYLHTVYVLTPI